MMRDRIGKSLEMWKFEPGCSISAHIHAHSVGHILVDMHVHVQQIAVYHNCADKMQDLISKTYSSILLE